MSTTHFLQWLVEHQGTQVILVPIVWMLAAGLAVFIAKGGIEW